MIIIDSLTKAKEWQITDRISGKRAIGANYDETAKSFGLPKKLAKSVWDNITS